MASASTVRSTIQVNLQIAAPFAYGKLLSSPQMGESCRRREPNPLVTNAMNIIVIALIVKTKKTAP